MKETYFFTSESVTEGHPDKIADQISDAILDEILAQDPQARVACETIVNTGLVLVFGEISTIAQVDYQQVVRQKIAEIGYINQEFGFDAEQVSVLVALDQQSPDIAQGVNDAFETRNQSTTELGAGDQGMMFGYATNESPAYMPATIDLSHRLAKRLAQVRKEGILAYLGPDGKSQVTVEFGIDGKPLRIDNIVISSQHKEDVSQERIKEDIIKHVIKEVVPSHLLDDQTIYYINPTGKFVIGGPVGDSGLTGRKIIVDTYGGASRHGGGAFSGKDATKVDRSASYAARYMAKNLVAAGVAKRLEIQLAYAIGLAYPTSINIESFGTSKYSNQQIIELIQEHFELTTSGIIRMLDLQKPRYSQTAVYGHFGRDEDSFTWEKLDKVQTIKDSLAK